MTSVEPQKEALAARTKLTEKELKRKLIELIWLLKKLRRNNNQDTSTIHKNTIQRWCKPLQFRIGDFNRSYAEME